MSRRDRPVPVSGIMVEWPMMNCWSVSASFERRKLPSFRADAFRSYPGAPVEVPLVLAQRIVFGAVGYAHGPGFEPRADFAKAAGVSR
jgi:hypothetical protein